MTTKDSTVGVALKKIGKIQVGQIDRLDYGGQKTLGLMWKTGFSRRVETRQKATL